jgi:hypothetical protein
MYSGSSLVAFRQTAATVGAVSRNGTYPHWVALRGASKLLAQVRALAAAVPSLVDLPEPVPAPSRQRQVRLSPERAAQLVVEYESGVEMYVLAERYGIHRHSVRAHLDRAGVVVRPRGLSEIQTDEAVRLYVAGWPLVRLAERLGCDHETVRRALKLRGVVLRKAWER